MNGYVITVRMTHDDLPLRLFATFTEAMAWLLQAVTPDAQDLSPETSQEIQSTPARLDMTTSDLINLDVVRFKDGIPSSAAASWNPENEHGGYFSVNPAIDDE